MEVNDLDLQRSSRDASNRIRDVGTNFINPKNGNSLLHDAASICPTAIFVYIRAGVFVNAPNFDGDTALHLAARVGNLSTSRALLMSGADLSLRNKLGLTPRDVSTGAIPELLHQFRPGLVVAVTKAEPAAVQRLTMLWCNPHSKVKDGKSAMELLSPRMTSEVCACRCYNYLKDRLHTLELIHATLADDADTLRTILETKKGWNAKIRFRDRHGMTPLSCAVDQNNLDLVRLLVETGRSSINVRVRQTENEPQTVPLYFKALSASCSQRLWAFLSQHADPSQDSQRDPEGNTAIFRAICNGKNATFMSALLEHAKGLNITHRNMAGETPREVAERLRRDDIVKVINEYLMNNSSRGLLINLPLTFYGKHQMQSTSIDEKTLRDSVLEGRNEVDIQATVHYSTIETQGRRLFKHTISGNLKAVAKLNRAIYKDKNGYTALIKAIVFNQPAVAELLITEKPQLRLEPDNKNRYPLHYAYAMAGPEGRALCKLLLQRDAGQLEHCPDMDGRTAADMGLLRGTPEVDQMLEDARTLDPFGRYIESAPFSDMTPSHLDPASLEPALREACHQLLLASEHSAVMV